MLDTVFPLQMLECKCENAGRRERGEWLVVLAVKRLRRFWRPLRGLCLQKRGENNFCVGDELGPSTVASPGRFRNLTSDNAEEADAL